MKLFRNGARIRILVEQEIGETSDRPGDKSVHFVNWREEIIRIPENDLDSASKDPLTYLKEAKMR